MTLAPEPSVSLGGLPAVEAELARILVAADAAVVTVRVLGSIGVALQAPAATALLSDGGRTYGDLDLAAYRRDSRAVGRVLTELGYLEDREISIASEGRRAIFDRPDRRFHIDVFFDRLEFCHVIPLAGRLETDRPTIPLAELLLSKLQIVKINQRDLLDAIALLLERPLGTSDPGAIDQDRAAALCAQDWGLWRTVSLNLEKVLAVAAYLAPFEPDQRTKVAQAVSGFKRRIDEEPKPTGWRMRARVGDRRKWWTDVDEAR